MSVHHTTRRTVESEAVSVNRCWSVGDEATAFLLPQIRTIGAIR